MAFVKKRMKNVTGVEREAGRVRGVGKLEQKSSYFFQKSTWKNLGAKKGKSNVATQQMCF